MCCFLQWTWQDFKEYGLKEKCLVWWGISRDLDVVSSIKDCSSESEHVATMKSFPNKIAYRLMSYYDVLDIKESKPLIYKLPNGAALDSAQQVAKYSDMSQCIWEIHDMEAGDYHHPRRKTLFKWVSIKYSKSIQHWAYSMFPQFCPFCIQISSWKKPKVGAPSYSWYGCAYLNRSDWLSIDARWLLQLCSYLPRSWHKILPVATSTTTVG